MSVSFNSFVPDIILILCVCFFSQHLYGCINPNFKMEKKFEEEVPRILKTLHYPFTISKSAMFAVGSMHTWPTLLGALHWMVELITVGYYESRVFITCAMTGSYLML